MCVYIYIYIYIDTRYDHVTGEDKKNEIIKRKKNETNKKYFAQRSTIH